MKWPISLLVLFCVPALASADDFTFPDTVAGQRAAAFFKSFNEDSDDAARAFELAHRAESALKARSVDERITQHRGLRERFGQLTPTQITDDQPLTLGITAKTASGSTVQMGFDLEPDEPHKLVGIRIMFGSRPGGGAVPDREIDADTVRETVEQVAAEMEKAYVYPDTGKKLAAALREKLAAGEYNELNRASGLAARLTSDLRAVCGDLHLGVRPTGTAARPGARTLIPGADRQGNYGFDKIEVLPGNVGLVRMSGFVPGEEARDTAAAALAFLRNCDALIFDLRQNGGGSPEMIQFLSSYLFDEPTHLNSFYNRLSEKTSETWTLKEVPGQRFGEDLPVYVLISNFTFSAAEEFTYNLKHLGRATIVGRSSGGGAHPVTMRPLNGFEVSVPYARAFNPITQKNWEGVGVKPHIECDTDKAIEQARKHFLARKAARSE